MQFKDSYGVLELMAFCEKKPNKKKKNEVMREKPDPDFYGKTDLNEHTNDNFWEIYRLEYKYSVK